MNAHTRQTEQPTMPGVKRNYWPVVVYQLFCYSE